MEKEKRDKERREVARKNLSIKLRKQAEERKARQEELM